MRHVRIRDVNVVDIHGRAALIFAAERGDLEMVRLLQKHGAITTRQINATFAKYPSIDDYVDKEQYENSLTDNDGAEELFDTTIQKFHQGLTDYWQDKLQKAYQAFTDNDDEQPLINFFTIDVYNRSDMLPEIVSHFVSTDRFFSLIELLLLKATPEEQIKLNKLQEAERKRLKRVGYRSTESAKQQEMKHIMARSRKMAESLSQEDFNLFGI